MVWKLDTISSAAAFKSFCHKASLLSRSIYNKKSATINEDENLIKQLLSNACWSNEVITNNQLGVRNCQKYKLLLMQHVDMSISR